MNSSHVPPPHVPREKPYSRIVAVAAVTVVMIAVWLSQWGTAFFAVIGTQVLELSSLKCRVYAETTGTYSRAICDPKDKQLK